MCNDECSYEQYEICRLDEYYMDTRYTLSNPQVLEKITGQKKIRRNFQQRVSIYACAINSLNENS